VYWSWHFSIATGAGDSFTFGSADFIWLNYGLFGGGVVRIEEPKDHIR
jgi:hypothetical protein